MHRVLMAAVAGAVLSAIPLAASAQTAPPLDLSSTVAYALAHNATILSQRATVAQDEATYARQHANEFPAIAGSFTNQLQRSQNTLGSFSQIGIAPSNKFSENTAQIGATWNINYGGSLAQYQAQEAYATFDSARANLRRSEQQLASDVGNNFYTLAARHEQVRLTESDRAYNAALLESARLQERVGRVAGVDVLRAQVNELRSEATLTSARADEANARESLAQQIGAAPDTPFAVPSALPEPVPPQTPLATLVSIAQSRRGDVIAARANLAYAYVQNRAIETDRLPQFQLTGAFGNQTVPSQGIVGTPGFWQIGATSTFSLPLIEYGARRAAHYAARTQIDAASANLQQAESGVEVDVRQQLRAVQTTNANLQTSKEAARLGAESARIAQLQYRNGLISLTDANQTEQSALQNETDLVNARVAYLAALFRLRVSLGTDAPLAIVETRTP